MEGMVQLRIRIPDVFNCAGSTCSEIVKYHNALCEDCLDAWVREKVAATALPPKPKFVHGATLSGNSGGLSKIHKFGILGASILLTICCYQL